MKQFDNRSLKRKGKVAIQKTERSGAWMRYWDLKEMRENKKIRILGLGIFIDDLKLKKLSKLGFGPLNKN